MEAFTKLSGWGNYPKINTSLKPLGFAAPNEYIYRGMGRSYGDQAICENGTTLSTLNHNRVLNFGAGLVTVQSGITLKELIHTLIPKGYMPMVCPGTEHVTIGGCIANDVHGKGHHFDGSFINSVKGFNLILPNGEKLRCSRNENTELFFANAGAGGLLGFIDTVDLWLRPVTSAYFKTKSYVAKSIDEMLELLDDEGLKWHYSVGWIDTLKKNYPGVLSVGNHYDPPTETQELLEIKDKEPINLPRVFPNGLLNGLSITMLNELIKIKQKGLNDLTHYQSFFFPLDVVKNWNVGYGSNGFLQYQFVIPLKNGHSNIKLILRAVELSGCKPFLNVLKRFGDSSAKYLSFPIEGYTLALDFAVSKNSISLCKKLNDLIGNMNGRVYLAKDALLDPDNFRKMYPSFKDWLKIKKEVDPYTTLRSAQSSRLRI